MKFRMLAVGKLREPYVAAAAADFRARLRRYEAYEEIEVTAAHGGDIDRATGVEGRRVLQLVAAGEPLWLLERTGHELSSLELTAKLADTTRLGHPRLTLAIAGTYGASEELARRADFHWSLSRLTLLHEWTRALVLEQLYRAAKIARNEPYHH